MPTGQDVWQILEDWLFDLIDTAASPGGVLGVQPNPDGSTGIQLVSRIAPPEQQTFPNIGLMAVEFDEDPTASHTHDTVTKFAIVIAVKQSHASTVADTGNAALQNLRNYQNDGAGNGLSPLLRTNVTLGGLAQWSTITKMERAVLKTEAEDADAIATAIYTFEAHMIVRTQ